MRRKTAVKVRAISRNALLRNLNGFKQEVADANTHVVRVIQYHADMPKIGFSGRTWSTIK